MNIGDNIKRIRLENKLTQFELGEILGVSNKAVSSWENGVKIPRMGVIEKMSQHFGIPKSVIIEGGDASPTESKALSSLIPIQIKKFPMLGEIACGEPVFANEDRESYIAAEADIGADFCLRVKGDSMINARIRDGDIVFIRQQPIVDDGEIAAVIIGDEATLKRFYFNREEQRVTLVAENPKYSPLVYSGAELESIRVLGKAVAFQSDLP